MNYLIDTNVLSELAKPQPNNKIVDWFEALPTDSLYVSVLTLGEIRKGIERMDESKRKKDLQHWFETTFMEIFSENILPINRDVAEKWGRLVAKTKKTLPAIDTLIAATALHFDLNLVTRNQKDFEATGVELVNPWVD